MKRFFSRFSAGASNPPADTLSPPPPFDQTWEKKDTPDDFAPARRTPNANSRSTGQRVKALAAKYESHSIKGDSRDSNASTRSTTRPNIDSAFEAHKPLPPPPRLDLKLDLSSLGDGSIASPIPTPATPAPAPATSDATTTLVRSRPTQVVSPAATLDAAPCRPSAPPAQQPQTVDASAPKSSPQGETAVAMPLGQAVGNQPSPKRPSTPSSGERHRHVEQRQASGGSQSSASHAAAVPKTVAFAPSPEKPSHANTGHQQSNLYLLPRSASPGLVASAISGPFSVGGRAAAAGSSIGETSASRTLSTPAEVGFTGNFAKPTVASAARARSSGRPSGSESTGWSSHNGGGSSATVSPTGERAPTLLAPRPVKLGRTNSLQSPARRTAGATSGTPADTDGGVAALTISSPTAIGSPAAASSSSLGHGGSPVHRGSLEANTIPFASLGQAQASSSSQAPSQIARASSPVSFGTPSSVPMQITNSAGSSSGHGQRPDSRRGSFAPSSMGSWRESHNFPFGSVGGRQFGVPSWSEMTQEELVHNLGPRERTRQEVLWEIVASEERYVAELEKVKELYIDALLHPDRFDPDRLIGDRASSAPGSSATETASPQLDMVSAAGRAARLSRRDVPATPAEAGSPASLGIGAASDLPIAARFMSATTTATGHRGEDDAWGSASGHDSSLYRVDSAAQAQVDRHRAAGSRSPYSAGLLNSAAAPTSTATPPQQHARGSGSRRNSLTGQGSGGRKSFASTPFAANSRSSLAHGLGLGIGPGQSRGTTARNASATIPAATTDTPTAARPKQVGRLTLSKVQKLREKSRAAGEGDPMVLAVPLPRSLKAVLESVSDGLVESHALLSEALKARYEEQWPLVRSLADVFMRYSHILQHYAAYVCHLQRALEELEEAALMERAMRGKRIKKEKLSQTVGLGRTVSALEAAALERGHGGLSIFVSMPFQRLLKYPLLFQNLLFHTDPSTHEFESTVAMVVEVERLVRSIEDEKVNAEERDKTRDAFARIEGLTDRQVLRPRADRTLIEEKAMYDESQRRTVSESAPKEPGSGLTDTSDHEGASGSGTDTPSKGGTGSRWGASPGLRAALRSKRSYRRLSDFLTAEDKGSTSTKAPSMGSKKDLWIVRFSDVEIKCQRVGVTALPMVSSAALTVDGSGAGAASHDASSGAVAAKDDGTSAEMDFARRSKESKERLKALRSTTLRAKTRNLYRFISVVAWRTAARQLGANGGVDADGDGGLDGLPTSHEVDEEDEEDASSGDSDADSSDARSSDSTSSGDEADGGFVGPDRYVRQSKLSFSYWGDKVEPRLAGRSGSGASSATGSPLVNASSVAAYRSASAGHGAAAGSSVSVGASSGGHAQGGGGSNASAIRRAPQPSGKRNGARSNELNSHPPRPISSGSVGMAASGAPVRRPPSPSKRASLGTPGVGGGGMSSRLAEPLGASSIHSAPEAVQAAVARMHAKRRNDKFGGRMRGLGNPPASAVAAPHHPPPALSVAPPAVAGTGAGASGESPSPNSSTSAVGTVVVQPAPPPPSSSSS